MFDELRVVTTAGWVARDLATGTELPVVHDLGLDAPARTTRTAWWAPHRFIARLAVTPGVTQPSLASPGPGWVATVDPKWLRRRVWAGLLGDVADSDLWGGRWAQGVTVFAKAAEIKLDRLPARAYGTAAGFTGDAERAGLTMSSAVVLSELIEFTHEFRCFVAPGPRTGLPTVVASSAYLIDGQTWDAWETREEAPDTTEAVAFAQCVVDDTAGPAGYVLDVGQLADGSWAVVEPNASWSSNPYHCEPAGVVASILAAQDPTGDLSWAWRSDPSLARYARPLPVRTL